MKLRGSAVLTLVVLPMLVVGSAGAQVPVRTAPLATQAQAAPPVSSAPIPDTLELAKLVWSTMAAIDHANQAGNYSVLRDLSSPAFQINNDAARLAEIFSSLRASRIDLGNALLLAPTYTVPPSVVSPGLIRVQGAFGLRPVAIDFDFAFQWVAGRWRLYGVSISPRAIATQMPSAATVVKPSKPPVR